VDAEAVVLEVLHPIDGIEKKVGLLRKFQVVGSGKKTIEEILADLLLRRRVPEIGEGDL
jgi:hypothetical protein